MQGLLGASLCEFAERSVNPKKVSVFRFQVSGSDESDWSDSSDS